MVKGEGARLVDGSRSNQDHRTRCVEGESTKGMRGEYRIGTYNRIAVKSPVRAVAMAQCGKELRDRMSIRAGVVEAAESSVALRIDSLRVLQF